MCLIVAYRVSGNCDKSHRHKLFGGSSAQSQIPERLWTLNGAGGTSSPGRNFLGSHHVVTVKGDFPQENGRFVSLTGRMLPPSKV